MTALQLRSVAVVLAASSALLASCDPVSVLGESCVAAPCGVGLICVDSVCVNPTPPTPPRPPCAEDADCTLDGSADGRACTDGVCTFAACSFDVQCGARVCDAGFCASPVVCISAADCVDGQRCDDQGVCRTPCSGDGDCVSLFGVNLAACDAGTCRQRCLLDQMCLGGLCENNLCVDPQCAADEDCAAEVGSFFCDAGRCTAFTPCAVDGDCFDVNFLCDGNGRCAERATCRVDAECGTDLCLDGHCRPTPTCASSDGCAADEECLAGRCVRAPACRTDNACPVDQLCAQGRCVPVPPAEPAAHLVLAAGDQLCHDGDAGCVLVLFPGEEVPMRAQAFAADGLPVDVEVALSVDGLATINPAGPSLVATTPGTSLLVAQAAGVSIEMRVVVVSPRVDPLRVLVVDANSGEPVVGATVTAGGVAVETNADGVALFAVADASGALSVLPATREDAPRAGVAFVPVTLSGDVRVRVPAVATGATGGVQVAVNGGGDETGELGLALALRSTSSALASDPATLLGPAFVGAISVQVLGDVPVTLAAAEIVDVTLPLSGAQEVKPLARLMLDPGVGAVLALEGRFPQADILPLAFSGDPVALGLDVVELAEGMDALLAGAGPVRSIPQVVDGDLADGTADIDGDGDTAERVPDYTAFAVLSLVPDKPPVERVGILVGALPPGAQARALAVCGVERAGVFLPLGVGIVAGTAPPPVGGEQVKVVAAPAGARAWTRACAVHALFADGSRSAGAVFSPGFGPGLSLAPLLVPPSGAFILADLPVAGAQSVVLPQVVGATHVVVAVTGASAQWIVYAPAGGQIALPAEVSGAVGSVTALRIGAAPPATVDGVVSAGTGPVQFDAAAIASATAP